MLVQNMPVATYIVCLYFWAMSPYSNILSHRHFILFAITTGIVFGRMATKVILAHLTKSKFPKFTVLLIPLIIGAVLTNLPVIFPSMYVSNESVSLRCTDYYFFISSDPIFTPESEYLFLLSYFAFSLVAYLRWAIVVINGFCDFLGIRCLVIPKPQKKVE